MFPLLDSGDIPMLIEKDEAILLEDDDDLAEGLIGGIWTSFKQSIPEAQAKVLVTGFNLIILGDPEQTSQDLEEIDGVLGNKTESLLPGMITNVLVDESITVAQQKMVVYELITNNIIETLVRLGFILNDDNLNHEKLQEMCEIVSFFYEMDSYEDLIGIADLLESSDIAPVDRFLMAMQKYLGEDADLTVHELLLLDVSEVTLKVIRDNLVFGEITEAMPETLIQRVRDNVETIKGTCAYDHIINNGQPGSAVDVYVSFFAPQLKPMLDAGTSESSLQYCKEMIGIFLISEVNSPRLKEELLEFLYTMINDHMVLNRVETAVNALVLKHEQA